MDEKLIAFLIHIFFRVSLGVKFKYCFSFPLFINLY